MENKPKNGAQNKRMFGKDITNLEKRAKAHSIWEKAPQMAEFRLKSRSLDKKSY